LNPNRVLVTGAGGFIGRWSIPALRRLGYETHALLSSRPRKVPAELDGAMVHRCDLFDDDAVHGLLNRVRPSHLLHFAWIATPGEYWQSADNARWLRSSRYLLQCFAGCGGVRTVMAGTCAEYDWSRADVCDEFATPLADAAGNAPSSYADSKIQMHRALAEFAARQRISHAWGRVFFQFGPYEHPQRLVPSVILHLLRNEEALCSQGTQVRAFLHVTDLAEAFVQLLHSPVEGPVNMGSAERISVAALIEKLAQQISRPDLVRLGARRGGEEPSLLVPRVERLYNEVQWRPRLSLEAGLSDTVSWWRENPNWRPA
jgi:nucleoside-diphosphate-sugar epimerase